MSEQAIVREGWEKFQAAVMPDGAPPYLTKGTRVAFYSGALHVFNEMFTSSGGQAGVDSEKLLQILKELQAFTVELANVFEREKLRNLTRY